MTDKKKHITKFNNQKKLVSAAAMLLVSVLMLGLSTYAWFTMSRELEVTGIQMTATAPENVQISLGELGNDGELSSGTGIIKTGTATDPGTARNSSDWSTSCDISKYYTFGHLFPASSTNGADIFATAGAAGEGRTLKSDATFFQANTTAGYYATLHAYTSAEKNSATVTSTWTGTRATSYNDTGDDGYYVDIPVWFRTNSTTGTQLTVVGYVTNSNNSITDKTDNSDIYKAVRVAVLNADGSANGGLVDLQNATAFATTTTNSIIDSYNYNTRTTGSSDVNAVSGLGTGDKGAWASVEMINPTGDSPETVVSLNTDAQKGTGNGEYGGALKKIIRIWIEGEDKQCYNANAGQNFKIALKFQ